MRFRKMQNLTETVVELRLRSDKRANNLSTKFKLTVSFESGSSSFSLYQVTSAGGRLPDVLQTRSYLFPAESGWFAPSIVTVNGLTVTEKFGGYFFFYIRFSWT